MYINTLFQFQDWEPCNLTESASRRTSTFLLVINLTFHFGISCGEFKVNLIKEMFK